jgi:hypothetical protein
MDTAPGAITEASGWPGRWETITREDYWRIIAENGGGEALTVAAGCTHPGGENLVRTAWARRDENWPLVQSEMDGCDLSLAPSDYARCPGLHTFQRFIYDPAMED